VPDKDLLNKIRPLWLYGGTLRKIVETCGDEATEICTELYGYQLPWLFHSVAQKLDKFAEENRVEALSRVGLLVELGLPTEAAAKVFLSGVRSREAAVELSRFVTNSAASITLIRKALLDPAIVKALSVSVTASTFEWLQLLSAEHGTSEAVPPQCARFSLSLKVPEDVNVLHVRQLKRHGELYLCSNDARFKCVVKATDELPFDKFADDPRFIFSRDGDAWNQQCRDPRI